MNWKRIFGNIYLLHVNLVIAWSKIKFSEELRTFELIQEVINDENGELLLDIYVFKISKVKTHALISLFF